MAGKFRDRFDLPEVKEPGKVALDACNNCKFYRETFGMCCRFPQSIRKALHEWCGEYAK